MADYQSIGSGRGNLVFKGFPLNTGLFVMTGKRVLKRRESAAMADCTCSVCMMTVLPAVCVFSDASAAGISA